MPYKRAPSPLPIHRKTPGEGRKGKGWGKNNTQLKAEDIMPTMQKIQPSLTCLNTDNQRSLTYEANQ